MSLQKDEDVGEEDSVKASGNFDEFDGLREKHKRNHHNIIMKVDQPEKRIQFQ